MNNEERNKAVMDWGYRSGLMLTQAQVTDLLNTLDGKPTERRAGYTIGSGGGPRIPVSMGTPTPGKGKYDGQPEHAQRGWKPE